MRTKFLIAAATAALAMPAVAQTTAPAPTSDAASTGTAATPPSASGSTVSGTTTQTAPSGGATASASVTQGAAVSGPEGNSVGTIESTDGQYAVVNTGTSKARLPVSAFGPNPKGGLVISMTKAQLESAASGAAQQTAASAKDLVTVGAKVSDTKGGAVGTVESVEGEFAVVATANNKVKLPLTAFGAGAGGPVIGMTATELDAAAKAASPGASASADSGGTGR